jgi:hypothetical protein
VRCTVLGGLAVASLLLPGAARAEFDLSYEALFTRSFAPDLELSFDDLVAGDVLEPGDPVAAGVAFGGVGDPDEQRALVVDAGGGDLELHSIDLGTPESPLQSRIVLAFDADAVGVGAEVDAPGDLFSNPNCTIYDPALDTLSFISVGGPVTSFFGWLGDATSRPLRFVEYRFAGDQPAAPFVLDDLAVRYVPEPSAAAPAAATLLALGARRARRRRGGVGS